MNFKAKTRSTGFDRKLGVVMGFATLFVSCSSPKLNSGGGGVQNPATSTPTPIATPLPSMQPFSAPVNPRGILTPQPTEIPSSPPQPIVTPIPQPTIVPVIGGSLTFNAIPFLNMEQGKHATDAGMFAILESNNRVVAYGPMSASAATNGKQIEGGGAYSASQLKINLKFRDAAAPQSGNGQLSICKIKTESLQNISSQNCVREKQTSLSRPTSWYQVRVPYSVQNDQVVISNKVYGQLDDVTGGLSLNHIIFSAAQGAQVATNDDGSSPLVFDLDGDGTVSLTPVQYGPKAVYFDLLNLGHKSSIGWVKPNDGLLVADFDGDGKIKDGSQLFGEASRPLKKLGKFELSPFMDGFDALAQYAESSKDTISAKDSIFTKLRIWRDKNQNGIADPGELTTLAQEKIVSVSLTKKRLGNSNNWPKIAGNEVRLEGYFTKENGQKGKIFDVWFAQDKKTVAKK